jgi:hypothetical protein
MTARAARISSVVAVLLTAACTSYYEIPIETPIRAKLDIGAFQRVLVAGFISGGSEDVDSNLETTRLLRSQLRNKSELRVIDVDVLPLMEIANEGREAGEANGSPAAEPGVIKDQKDLEPYEHVFANAEYWKKIGEEHQNPLIVTGTILFLPRTSNSVVQRDAEVFDNLGRRRVIPTRQFVERKGFELNGRFIFIDGRTGEQLTSQMFGETVMYSTQQTTPALSSYFELMDRLIPNFLSTLSSTKVKGTRILLQ